jgi:hypothetical protein
MGFRAPETASQRFTRQTALSSGFRVPGRHVPAILLPRGRPPGTGRRKIPHEFTPTGRMGNLTRSGRISGDAAAGHRPVRPGRLGASQSIARAPPGRDVTDGRRCPFARLAQTDGHVQPLAGLMPSITPGHFDATRLLRPFISGARMATVATRHPCRQAQYLGIINAFGVGQPRPRPYMPSRCQR